MLNLRGVKARPFDLERMLALNPALVEMHCSTDDLKWTPTRAYELPLAVHVPEYADGELLDPASLDEAKRLRAATTYANAAGRAAAWAASFSGRPRVVFHPGGQTCDENPMPTNRDALFDALGKTVDAMKAAAGNDVDILIENLPGVCWFNGGSWKAQFMTSGSDVAQLCNEKGIGATLDLCHLHMTPHNVVQEIKILLPHVRHIHYSDARYRDANGQYLYKEGLQIGEGDMPLEAYFAALAPLAAESKTAVYAVPEVWYGHENGGAAFVEAWRKTADRLVRPAVRI